MKKIPLNIYVAANNPNGAINIIRKFNLASPRNQHDLVRGLRHVMLTKGEEGFIEIAKAHPDKQLILDSHSIINESSNACGCMSNTNGPLSHNAPNQNLIDEIKEIKLQGKLNDNQLTKEDVSVEVKKALNEKNLFVKDALPYVALIGIGMFLFKGMLKN